MSESPKAPVEKKVRKSKKKAVESEGASAEAAVPVEPAVVPEPVAEPKVDVVEAPKVETPKVETPKVEEKKEEPKEEEKKEEKKEEEKVEKPKDVEEDAAIDKRRRITDKCAFSSVDATINVCVSDEGALSSFQQAGMGTLLGGSRANVGVKSGRYYYEVRVVDLLDARQNQGKYELHVGFGTAATRVTGGADGSFLFDIPNGGFRNGATKKQFAQRGQLARGSDVVGVLLNRDGTSPQNNTISLFVNGERKTEPQEFDEPAALFPHIVFKGCSILPNFRSVWKMPQFTVRPLGDSSQADVEMSTVVAVETPEVVFPIGFDCDDYITEFAANHPEYTVITTERMKAWAELSPAGQLPPCCTDGGKHIGTMMRNRKYIVKMSDTNFPQERKILCLRFSGYKKKAHVMLSETNRHVAAYDKVTLPTSEEGFDEIVYVKPKEECEKALEDWKADCKLRSRVDDLKVGPFFKEKMAAFQKLLVEKKKDKEAYPDFTPEDYMLVNLRAEVHNLVHAFKIDVNEMRPGFAADQFSFYFKKYAMKPFDLNSFKLSKVEDMTTLIPDVLSINEKTLLLPVLDKDADPITFFEFAETERKDRQDRLDAGDENAALGFSASKPKPMPARLPSKDNKPIKVPAKGTGKGFYQQIPVPPTHPGHQPMRAISGAIKRAAPGAWHQSMQKRR